MEYGFLVLAVLALAFANGANDNFKGVATLHGCGRLGFKSALTYATVTTLAGSFAALLLGTHLVATFSGKGLVPNELVGEPSFVLAVATGAAATVLLATRFGLPISTTHALIGALVGGGLVAAGSEVNLSRLLSTAMLPLLISPLAAFALTWGLYQLARRGRTLLRIDEHSCVCFTTDSKQAELNMASANEVAYHTAYRSNVGSLANGAATAALVMHVAGCPSSSSSRTLRVDARTVLNVGHFLSAGAVGFARGVNDTPKIVALLAVGTVLGMNQAVVLVAVAIALGGLLQARRVAQTLSHEITAMNDGQGFAGNAVTAFLVLVASRFGMPVSTTHVSVGALFGIGAANGSGRRQMILAILGSWLITLPLATAFAAITMAALA